MTDGTLDMGNRLLTILISSLLIGFFSFPLGMILYGGGATALGGASIIGGLIVLQLPGFLLFQKLGWLPKVKRDDSTGT